MNLTKLDIAKYVYDPNMVQTLVINALSEETADNKTIVDPTNPFMMLMELAVSSAQNAVVEPLGVIRKLHPDLADKPEDLYRHLSDSELTNLFSIPTEVAMLFYINVKDLKSNGYRPTGATYLETTLPTGTEVTVANTVFTLLNNIVVKLYDTGIVFVEQQISSDDIAINNLGVLNSGIVSFQDGEEWIAFETILKQVKKYSINKAITPAEGFKLTATLKEQYYFSVVKYKNANTNDVYLTLNKTHSGEYINSNVPTVYIELQNKNVVFKIPDVFLYNNIVSGNISIDVYETRGVLYLPLNKYKAEDFKVSIKSNGLTASEATIPHITVLANSRSIAEGGKNSIDMETLRNAVINNSTGDIDVPITTENIKQKGLLQGFELYKSYDIITERVFLANKNIPKYNSPLVYCRPDIYFNSIGITPSDLPNTTDIVVTDDYLIIKAGTVFKEVNYKVSPISSNEKFALKNMNINDLVDYTNNVNYYYTPYYYILDNNTIDTIDTRVYNLDSPYLLDSRIIGKNTSLIERVNSKQYTIVKTVSGYSIIINVSTNTEFDGLDSEYIRGQVSIPTLGDVANVKFYSVYNLDNKSFTFNIDTSLYVDLDNYLELTNGDSTVSNKFVKLESLLTFHVYTVDPDVLTNNNYLVTEIGNTEGYEITVFNKEEFSITFGKRIDYIWNKMYNTYTERMYMKYTTDIPLTHTEDVYKIFEETGTIFNCPEDPDEDVTTEILHLAGDPVLDSNGVVIYKHRKGDIVLDSNNLPIIDLHSGVVRNIDLLMLEYEFALANSNIYTNYLGINIDTINNWLFTVIPSINSGLLENTKVLYKSYKKTEQVSVVVNNTTINIPYLTSPIVTLYTSRSSYTDDEIDTITAAIGDIIHTQLDNFKISIKDMKDEILKVVGSEVVGVKITNIEPTENSEIFSFVDKTKRLVLKKKLVINKNSELIVKYDIKINITTI